MWRFGPRRMFRWPCEFVSHSAMPHGLASSRIVRDREAGNPWGARSKSRTGYTPAALEERLTELDRLVSDDVVGPHPFNVRAKLNKDRDPSAVGTPDELQKLLVDVVKESSWIQ